MCNVCGSKKAYVIYQSGKPLSITSDLRVWKAAVKVFQCRKCGHIFKYAKGIKKEIDKIYKSYQLFEDEEGQDQAIFLQGLPPKSRTKILVESLSSLARLPDAGNFLDIGCNKGLLLGEFSRTYPNWLVFGYEISNFYEKYIRKIPKYGGFYSGDIGKMAERKEKFDFITMIHTLEHVENPAKFLKKVRRLLKPGGFLLIQVPNYLLNAFDILVFEHISHFSLQTLEQLLINTGFEPVVGSTQVIPKELTFISKISEEGLNGQLNFGSYLRKVSRKNIKFLMEFERLILRIGKKRPLIIFGTAEVGTWVAGLLDGKVDLFVDESPWRIGRKHLGIRVKHPKVLKRRDNVILAMAPILVQKVYDKWKHTKANFFYPFN